MEPEYHNTIFKKLCSGMNCLTAEQRETLQQWLQEVFLARPRPPSIQSVLLHLSLPHSLSLCSFCSMFQVES